MVTKVKYYDDHNTSNKPQWWKEKDADMYQAVFGLKDNINTNSQNRRDNFVRYAQFYNDQPIRGLTATTFNQLAANVKYIDSRISYNVVKVCTDAVAAKLAKNKPRPLFITEKGNYSLQRRAKNLTQYIDGLFDCLGTGTGDTRTMYGIGRRVFVDSAVFGIGAAKLYKCNGQVKAERVNITEIYVDDIDGMHETPRQLMQCKLMHREVVKELFPKHKDKIMMCRTGIKGEEGLSNSTSDMIEVIESWHLPSGEGAKDGCHAICIDNATLFKEPYEKEYFPFIFLRWTPSLVGFWGIGITEELIGLQLEINKLLTNIQQAQHLFAVPQVWLDISNRAHVAKMSNKMGAKYFYSGTPPTFLTPTAMSSEIYQHLERLYQKAFEIVGVSQLSAQSKKPSGLDSGVALREFQDIESERFMLAGIRYEDFFLDAARICIDLTRDLQKEGHNPKVTIKDPKFMKQIKWSECDLEDSAYTMRVFPAGALPQTPAGKLQKVQELTQAGFFSKEEALELLEMPDIKGQTSITLANRNAVKRIVEKIVEDGIPQVPEPPMDLQFALSWSQAQYNQGIAEDLPPDRLELLLRFMDDTNMLLNPPAPPAPPVDPNAMPPQAPMDPAMMEQMAAEQGMQTAMPEPMPTNELIPQQGVV